MKNRRLLHAFCWYIKKKSFILAKTTLLMFGTLMTLGGTFFYGKKKCYIS